MSNFACKSNLNYPTDKCFNCKYWERAHKSVYGWEEAGRCTVGYCKKDLLKRGKKNGR